MFRKYSNRRLYDLDAKSYCTIASRRQQFLDGEQVFEHRTHKNITALTIAQLIVLDLEEGHGPPADLLRPLLNPSVGKTLETRRVPANLIVSGPKGR
jgi:polyhydroxyalkanoate synthesis regulator protein